MRNIEDVYQTMDTCSHLWAGIEPGVQKNFRRWIAGNLHILEAFEIVSVDLRHTGGRDYYSIYNIREKLRWDSEIRQNPKSSHFKINNNYTSSMARLLMAINPSLYGMFRIRSGPLQELGL